LFGRTEILFYICSEQKTNTMRDLLEKQIIEDAKKGDTTVLAEILGLITDEQVFSGLSDYHQRNFTHITVEGGMILTALVEIKGHCSNWNKPHSITIKKGTKLITSNHSQNDGSLFTKLYEGEAMQHSRDGDGDKELVLGTSIGINTGHVSAPYSKGQLDKKYWSID